MARKTALDKAREEVAMQIRSLQTELTSAKELADDLKRRIEVRKAEAKNTARELYEHRRLLTETRTILAATTARENRLQAQLDRILETMHNFSNIIRDA